MYLFSANNLGIIYSQIPKFYFFNIKVNVLELFSENFVISKPYSPTCVCVKCKN